MGQYSCIFGLFGPTASEGQKMGDIQTVWTQKDRGQKIQGPKPIGARKAVFSHKKGFHSVVRENQFNPGTGIAKPSSSIR